MAMRSTNRMSRVPKKCILKGWSRQLSLYATLDSNFRFLCHFLPMSPCWRSSAFCPTRPGFRDMRESRRRTGSWKKQHSTTKQQSHQVCRISTFKKSSSVPQSSARLSASCLKLFVFWSMVYWVMIWLSRLSLPRHFSQSLQQYSDTWYTDQVTTKEVRSTDSRQYLTGRPTIAMGFQVYWPLLAARNSNFCTVTADPPVPCVVNDNVGNPMADAVLKFTLGHMQVKIFIVFL